MAKLSPSLERVSGAFVNLKQGLFLRFQLNPKEIDISKVTNYGIEAKSGLDAPWIHWANGGEYKISFELFFDRTGASRTTAPVNVSFPQTGLMDVEAIIQSFLRPAEDFNLMGVSSLIDLLRSRPQKTFTAPPDCYFIYGVRWWRCKLLSAPMKETIHDQFLAPKQVTFNVELLVLESGEVYKVEEQSRHALAIVGGLTTSGLGINVLNDIGGATIGIIT